MPISQIVFGTDYPVSDRRRPRQLGLTAFFKGDDLKAVDRENALRLIPRLKNSLKQTRRFETIKVARFS